MYDSRDACCSYIAWAKPHLLMFIDDFIAKSLDPSTGRVTQLAGLSDLAVSPDGRWFAGEGSGDPKVSPEATTVYVLSVRARECLVVHGRSDIAGFTPDSKSVIVRTDGTGGSQLRQFALASLRGGCPGIALTRFRENKQGMRVGG